MTSQEIIDLLHLQPHPKEGGYFCEIYRSDEGVGEDSLPDRYSGARCFGTAIYYLLTPETFSAMHRLQSDEIFHFYCGDPVQMLHLYPDGTGQVVILGSDLTAGMRPQIVVSRGVWQGAKLARGGRFALLGTTVSPGFEFADYEHGTLELLLESYPQFREQIAELSLDC